MASYADAYGYTPDQFMSLTLPNLSQFGEHAKRQSEEMERASSKGKTGFSSSSTGSISKNGDNTRQGQWKSGTSIESLIGMYGSKEAKRNILSEKLNQPKKEEKQ